MSAATVPPFLGGHMLVVFLLQAALLLLAALLLGRLAARLGMPAIVGEFAAGILLGPSLLGWILPGLSQWLFPAQTAQLQLLDAVGQLGVLLLVGLSGAHLDLDLVRRQGATAARVSVFGLIVPLGLGIGAGWLLPASLMGTGSRPVLATFLGVALCVSAVPVIAKTLIDLGVMHRNVSQLTLAGGVLDDAFGWCMLSVLSGVVTIGLRASAVLWSLGALALLIGTAVIVGRPVVRQVFRIANRSTDSTPVVASVVVLLLLSAAASSVLGLEAMLGPFVCGILISQYGRPNPAMLGALRTVVLGVLAPVFFATVGLRMDLTALADPELLAVAAVMLLLAVAGKFVGAYLGARLSRLNRWEALALGAGMNARGVVGIVVAMLGLRLGILTPAMFTVIVLIAAVTSMMAPPILRFAMARIELTEEERLRRQHIALTFDRPADPVPQPSPGGQS